MALIDGKKIADEILQKLKVEISTLAFKPIFYDIVVGSDPVAMKYVSIKAVKARELGIDFRTEQMPEDTTTERLVGFIKEVQNEPHVCGVIVQLPLPPKIHRLSVVQAIKPGVDVDCLNGGQFIPPTVAAVMEILENYQIDWQNLPVLIVGQGDLVGRPLAAAMKNATNLKTLDEKSSSELIRIAPEADIIISAAGVPNLITGKYVRPDAVVIDCGTSESAGSIVGDVDAKTVGPKAKLLAAVPGGVGPITVAKLYTNVLLAANSQK